MQASVEAGDDVACLHIAQIAEGFGMQPLEQQCAVRRIGTQKPDGTVATPAPKNEMLMFGLRVGTADLEDGARSVAAAHRLNDRAAPIDGIAIGPELPLVELPLEHDVDRSLRHVPTL